MRVGIFGDIWTACTGFSIVCGNLARQLGYHKDLEVYYFGRFGCEKDFVKEPENIHNFLGVRCEGGVWKRETCVRIINEYKLDLVFTEDDWFSIEGIQETTGFWGKPFFWLSPVDSLPVRLEGLHRMRKADQVFVPSRGAQTYLHGNNINAVYLPHGVTRDFRPIKVDNKPDHFTFIWVGRDSKRKCLGRVVMAFENLVNNGVKCYLLVRADWTVPQAKRTHNYIVRKNLPVIMEQMEDIPHKELVKTYNRGDCFICSAKAGGFEMGVIEAQACGLPVLVTDHTFMNEQVVDGKNGFLVHLDRKKPYLKSEHGGIWGNISIKDLTDKIMFYVDHPEIAKVHGNWGMVWVNQTYKWKTVGDILYEQIKKVTC